MALSPAPAPAPGPALDAGLPGAPDAALAGALDVAFAVACVFVGAQLATLLVNLRAFPVLRPAPPRGGARERVSILVPARDEARNLPDTLPRLLAQGALEVVALDDGSSDATPDILARMAARHPRLRVLRGRPPPEGWTGKAWACRQLADAAAGEWLAFTDADVRWEPGALDALLALREREGADFASVWPRQRVGSPAERVAVPQIDLILLGALPYPAVRRAPHASLAAGNGQLMLFRRDAYERAGGHGAVRGSALEDVRLAQLAKGAGARVALALGGRLVSARMYRGAREVAAGFGRNVLAAASGSRPLLAALLLVNLLAYTAAWPLAALEPRWLVPALGGWLLRGLSAGKAGRGAWEAPLQTLAPLAALWVGVPALRRGRRFAWKGRSYG